MHRWTSLDQITIGREVKFQECVCLSLLFFCFAKSISSEVNRTKVISLLQNIRLKLLTGFKLNWCCLNTTSCIFCSTNKCTSMERFLINTKWTNVQTSILINMTKDTKKKEVMSVFVMLNAHQHWLVYLTGVEYND